MKELSLDINLFKQGDRRTFKVLFERLYQIQCLFTNRYTNNLAAAEDIVQETFLTLWNRREEMTSLGHIKSFLYLANRNAALDYLKHQKIRAQYEQQTLETGTTENFEHYVIAEEVEQILLNIQENLPEKCKQIFILAMQGKDNETIAAELNISVNTVKTQKKIAYKKLKSYISELSYLLLLIHQI